jgi:hypothetical protein
MTQAFDREYARAAHLATILEERLLHDSKSELAGHTPLEDVSWDDQRLRLAGLLDALAYLVEPDRSARPSPEAARMLPASLVVDLREKARAGEDPVTDLKRAATRLRTGPNNLQDADEQLLGGLARQAGEEAADAYRRAVTD